MQIFVPYDNIFHSLNCLDKKRLWKQAVECRQILNILENNKTTGGWVNHPAVVQFRESIGFVQHYYNTCLKLNIEKFCVKIKKLQPIDNPARLVYPVWWGYSPLHDSHKARLLNKLPEWYSQFGWCITERSEEDGYIWAYHNGQLLPEIQEWRQKCLV